MIDRFARPANRRHNGLCAGIGHAPDTNPRVSCAAEAWPGRLDRDGPADTLFELFADDWIECPIFSRFEEIVARHGDRIAVDDGSRRLTFNELGRASAHLAQRIAELVPPGRPVGILLPHGALFPVAALACLAVGRPFVPIDLGYPQSRNEHVIREARVMALIVERESGVSNFAGSIPCLEIGRSLRCSDSAPLTISPAEGPAIILYTSGSTGDPKGICNDQRAILQRVWHATNACHIGSQDRFIVLSSSSTIAGIRDIFVALLNGASAYLADPYRLGIRGVLRVLSEQKITLAYAVPALLRQLLQLPGASEALAQMRVIRLGGDLTLASDLANCRKILPRNCRVLVGFGSTEVPTVFHWFVPREWKPAGANVPLGFAQPGIEFRLVDDQGAPVTPGEAGELLVKSRYLALGLWQDGRLVAGPMLTVADDSRARIFRTGDLIRQLPEGLYEMVGRADRQIKIRGLRVDPAETESVLRTCEGVRDAAVIVRQQGQEVRQLVAYVVLSQSPASALLRDLKRALAARLPQHLRPTEIRFLEAIPQLPGFKTDLRALEDMDRRALATEAELTNSAGEGATAPGVLGSEDSRQEARCLQPGVESRVLAAVRRAWSAVLNRYSFDDNLPWEDAGGDSLNIMQLWFMIEDELGRSFPLELFSGRTTPRGLIESINREIEKSTVQQSSPTPSPQGRRAYFFPTTGGDVPILARFRHQLRGEIDFRVVRYPNWQEMIDGGAELSTIAQFAAQQILADDGGVECFLIGYSFGGFVAWEAARRLQQMGVLIRFIGLIDTRTQVQLRKPESFLERVRRRLRTVIMRPLSTVANAWWWRVFPWLVEIAPHTPLRHVGTALIRAKLTSRLGWELLVHLRLVSLLRWAPEPLDIPTWLFRSDEFYESAPSFGWDKLCKRLRVVSVSGSHDTVFDPPNLRGLCEKVAAAVCVAAASSSCPATERNGNSHP